MGFSPAAHSLTVTPTCYSSRLSVRYAVVFVLLEVYHAHRVLSILFSFIPPNSFNCR